SAPPAHALEQPARSLTRVPVGLVSPLCPLVFLFFTSAPTTRTSTLSLHDALPISRTGSARGRSCSATSATACRWPATATNSWRRSEEHTSELQSLTNLVCRLLLEKKKKNIHRPIASPAHPCARPSS